VAFVAKNSLIFLYNRLQIFKYQEQVEWVGGAGFEFPLGIALQELIQGRMGTVEKFDRICRTELM